MSEDINTLRATIQAIAAELTAWIARANAIPGVTARVRTETTLPGIGDGPPGGVVIVRATVATTNRVDAG